MPRELALSNGRLHVALDDRYEVRDLYWPFVGHENHAIGHRSRFGVAVAARRGGRAAPAFAWVAGDEWRRSLRYVKGALVTDCALRSRALGIELATRDAVLPEADVLVRRVEARPLAGAKAAPAEARLYFHLDLHVSGTDLGDTVAADPGSGGLVHYKRDRWFLQNGVVAGGRGPSGYACGQKEFREHEGTWRDAEDGRLSGNAVSHGACDGVLELTLDLKGRERAVAWWWLSVGPSREAVDALDAAVRANPEAHLDRATGWWRSVTGRRRAPVAGRLADAYRRSLALVLANCDARGGVLAANDTDITSFNRDTYSYVWPRDGAFVAHALDVAGHHEAAKRFLRYVVPLFEPEGYLKHKFTVDGLLASTWHASVLDGKAALPVQEDETALVVWALAEHVRMTGDWGLAVEAYERAVRRSAEWMLSFRGKDGLPRASWDPWEERRGSLTYTTATVVAALEGAAFLADGIGDAARATRWREGAAEVRGALDGLWLAKERRFARMRGQDGKLDATEDASLVMLPWLGVLPPRDPRVRSTMKAVWKRLEVAGPVGGVARYVHDYYHRVEDAGDADVYPGNPWFVCTLWKADWLSMMGDAEAALDVLRWAVARATPSGVMAEQLHPRSGAPLSVAPLTWSHAAFVESCHRVAGDVPVAAAR